MALCGNTCAAGSNGVCDEGRLDSYAAVRCSLALGLCSAHPRSRRSAWIVQWPQCALDS